MLKVDNVIVNTNPVNMLDIGTLWHWNFEWNYNVFTSTNRTIYGQFGKPLNMQNLPSSLWSDKCDYLDIVKCNNLNPKNYNFIVMQLNIRSILSNQLELKRLLNELSQKHSEVDILLLSEIFITSKTENLINMKGYMIHTTNRKEARGGGTAVLIKKGTTHKRRKDLENMVEKEAESTLIEMIAKNGKKFVVGSLYRSPNMK